MMLTVTAIAGETVNTNRESSHGNHKKLEATLICDQCQKDQEKTTRTVVLTTKGQYDVILCEDCVLTLNSTAAHQRAARMGRIANLMPERLTPFPEGQMLAGDASVIGQLRQIPPHLAATTDELINAGILIPLTVETKERKTQPTGNHPQGNAGA